jgi:tetratricopeptide (TPR) repeat protein
MPGAVSAHAARWQISYPLRKLGRRHEALQAAMEAAAAPGPPSVNAQLAVGDAELDLGRREAALAHYRTALALAEKRAADAPKNLRARAELADTYQRLGAHYEALRDGSSAGEWQEKAHGVWESWASRGGISNAFVIRKQRETAQALARNRTGNHQPK